MSGLLCTLSLTAPPTHTHTCIPYPCTHTLACTLVRPCGPGQVASASYSGQDCGDGGPAWADSRKEGVGNLTSSSGKPGCDEYPSPALLQWTGSTSELLSGGCSVKNIPGHMGGQGQSLPRAEDKQGEANVVALGGTGGAPQLGPPRGKARQ